jgi:hypothetical protein
MAVAVAGACLAGEARADELQNRIVALAAATRSDAYGFRRTVVIERTGSARKVVVEQFDPRRPADLRWSLLSVDARAPTAKEVEQSRKAKRGPVPSYAEVAEWFGAPATRSAATPGYVTYRFARLPRGAFKIGSHDASADTAAEALVNVGGRIPFVERVRLTSNKGFRMMLVVSVARLAATTRYRLLPDGHAVPAETASDLSGSLFGKAGHLRAMTTFADVHAVR